MLSSSNNLSTHFELAVSFISGSNLADNVELQLKLYGLYKQSREGPCNQPKPPLYDLKGRKKWYAWSEKGSMSKEEAMEKYIELVKSINPNFQSEKTGWVTVSTFADKEEPISDSKKTISDWVKEGNLAKILTFKGDININDEMGMAPIHWASDRGNLPILKLLIEELSANINLQDEMGQTALHYAITCNHDDICLYLIEKGAKTDIPDEDGITAFQIFSESDSRLKSLLFHTS
ncbi:acyl-CoA-binding domain-containing protein 6-like [Daktulosphaira vitifoliae]|uniref:acyl-CoA-binding domain-containing protein 6-like n=1 Tax=Daktulosphaira vitifoliae TaxID=58002 RepID=UPI0021A9C1A1|nr:acyl-CoA-binding domain-containing protein 6-like [Daktulosphaira vitifoliae]